MFLAISDLNRARMAFLVIIAGLSLGRALTLAQAPATKPTDPEEAHVQKLIDQLDDADPQVRLTASLQLNSLSAGALHAAEAALKADDLSPESRVRLEGALKFIRPRAAIEQARLERKEWKSRLFRNAYRNGGHTGAKWDADVEAGIDLYLELDASPSGASPDLRQRIIEAFTKAELAGCTDPLIRALRRIADGQPELGRSRPRRTGAEAMMYECCQGDYPPEVKFHVWGSLIAMQVILFDEDVAPLTEYLKASLQRGHLVESDIDQRLWLLGDRGDKVLEHPLWKGFFQTYQQLSPQSPFPLLFEARATEAQADHFRLQTVNKNKQDAASGMRYDQLLLDACKTAARATDLNPADNRAAIFILRAQNRMQGWREIDPHDVESWFARCIQIDPDDRAPYDLNIAYLSRFDDDRLVAFGHQCLQSQNWQGGIALLIVNVHEHAADASPDRAAYFQQASVWQDIRSAYEGGLLIFPDDAKRRCEYAKYACLCTQWAVADQQFQRIGDHPVIEVFGSESSFKYLRNKAHQLASESSQ